MTRSLLWILIFFAVAVGLYLLHRAALWAEARGWIYYKHKRADPASIGSALLELDQIARPQQKHVLEVRRVRRRETATPGDPPSGSAKSP